MCIRYRAHIEQATPAADTVAKIERVDVQILREENTIESLTKKIDRLRTGVSDSASVQIAREQDIIDTANEKIEQDVNLITLQIDTIKEEIKDIQAQADKKIDIEQKKLDKLDEAVNAVLTANKNFFNEEDWKLTYSDQSQKLLLLNNITVRDIFPELKINFERDDIDINIKKIDKKIISFGIDSSEEFRMWYEELFVELANILFEKNIFDKVYLICSKKNDHMASKIISLSQNKYFINCSKYDLANIMGILKKSSFFVGNNSGPMNMAAALGVKSFGLICNDPVSELKYSNILTITPDNYDENLLSRDRNDMKNLTVEKVSNFILEKIK